MQKLGKVVADDADAVDIYPMIGLCTLDIICETAMGRGVGAQLNGDSEYVNAVYESSTIVFHRALCPWLWNDWMFALSPSGRQFNRNLKTLHDFTESVIKERKEQLKDDHMTGDTDENDFGSKKRLAFLDLLIDASQDGEVLTDLDIREEVDTFMFEGHDTTSSNITMTLYLLATHPEVQDKVWQEMRGIFGESDRRPTSADLNNMKYLTTVIKVQY